MYLSSVFLNNFRNYPELKISFEKNGALFTGVNGAGKTNLLESIFFLSTGRSQRGASKKQMITVDCSEAFVEGNFITDNGQKQIISIGFSKDGRKKIKINGSAEKSLSDWYSLSNVVSFGPEDINLVYGPPVLRRRYMDMLLCTIDNEYLDHLKKYKKALLNRNRMLTMNFSRLEIELYEKQMAESGAYIMKKRESFLLDSDDLFKKLFLEICSIKGYYKYIPSFKIDNPRNENLAGEISKRLEINRIRDNERGYTLRGPHRDDIYLYIDDKSAKSFGSQGQCRSLCVSLRLLSLDLIRSIKRGDVIILVDDAFSQLDNRRRDNILSFFKDSDQLFITSTGTRVEKADNLEKIYISGGKIEK